MRTALAQRVDDDASRVTRDCFRRSARRLQHIAGLELTVGRLDGVACVSAMSSAGSATVLAAPDHDLARLARAQVFHSQVDGLARSQANRFTHGVEVAPSARLARVVGVGDVDLSLGEARLTASGVSRDLAARLDILTVRTWLVFAGYALTWRLEDVAYGELTYRWPDRPAVETAVRIASGATVLVAPHDDLTSLTPATVGGGVCHRDIHGLAVAKADVLAIEVEVHPDTPAAMIDAGDLDDLLPLPSLARARDLAAFGDAVRVSAAAVGMEAVVWAATVRTRSGTFDDPADLAAVAGVLRRGSLTLVQAVLDDILQELAAALLAQASRGARATGVRYGLTLVLGHET